MYADPKSQTEDRLQHFRSELVALIKKASQTYLTGYFVFQIQQPICFCLLGAVESARLGFTQSIGTTFIGLPSIWLAMNFPKLAHHIADKEFPQAASLFRTKWFQVCALSVFAGIVSWGVTLVITDFPRFHDRLMDPTSTGLLYLAMTIQTIALGLTYWPRAFKIEPFVRIAYVQMVLTPLFLWIAMSYLGVRGAAVGNLGSWVIGVVGIYLIFRSYWHKEEWKEAIKPAV
jgi:Na+-driven multidrug efflux pump